MVATPHAVRRRPACWTCSCGSCAPCSDDSAWGPSDVTLGPRPLPHPPVDKIRSDQVGPPTKIGSDCNTVFDLSAGWKYKDITIDGKDLQYAVALAPTPHNVSYIWWAPNHVRAFPREAYLAVGGYDPQRTVLDDQDLMGRLYQLGPFHLIDDCLYLQRMHDHNTQRDAETNAFIQQETIALYDRNIERNALAWAKREGLLALDLGAAHGRPDGYLGIDQQDELGIGIVATLPQPLDLPDSSVGVIRAFDFLEHVADKVALINELHRLLAPGGLLLSTTPSTDGRGAFQDPDPRRLLQRELVLVLHGGQLPQLHTGDNR